MPGLPELAVQRASVLVRGGASALRGLHGRVGRYPHREQLPSVSPAARRNGAAQSGPECHQVPAGHAGRLPAYGRNRAAQRLRVLDTAQRRLRAHVSRLGTQLLVPAELLEYAKAGGGAGVKRIRGGIRGVRGPEAQAACERAVPLRPRRRALLYQNIKTSRRRTSSRSSCSRSR
jgi:hypothetical protein